MQLGSPQAFNLRHHSERATRVCKAIYGDCLMLYAVVDASTQTEATAYLLSIRPCRELAIDFARWWLGATAPDQR